MYKAMKTVPLKSPYTYEITSYRSPLTVDEPLVYDSEEFAYTFISKKIKKKTMNKRISYVSQMFVKKLIHFGMSLCQPIKYLDEQNPIYHRYLQSIDLILE